MSDKNGHLLKESLRIRDIIAEAYISAPKDTKRMQSTLLQMNPTAWCLLNKTKLKETEIREEIVASIKYSRRTTNID